ncbi:protein LURP-one-related 15-like isoform X2 [Salvia miltiorrhiza]|uniref:protein LURP-one-related 15-like isoform X2 n=1 Tax=Salvia miltiorrhiza TaxID=226208 RepID=UPI0025ACDDE3|nr:protein LURP-one-related 15-like isoform X2 [Salvia miltiorrhiza]
MARVKMEDLTAVISRDFCVPQRVNLTVVRKLLAVTDCNFEVIDEDGNIMFKVKQKLFSLHDRRILLDAGGTPIATLRKKHLSARKRWQVFKGESSDSSQLLFTARKSSLVQLKTELDIFLSGNEDETSWDFKVVGGWLERSCIIYSKGWNHIAKMHKKHTLESVVLGKDMFSATVYPKVDIAFITALVVILYEINKDKDD